MILVFNQNYLKIHLIQSYIKYDIVFLEILLFFHNQIVCKYKLAKYQLEAKLIDTITNQFKDCNKI